MRKIKNEELLEERAAWLESLMEEYGERLTGLSYNYVKDWKQAEDIVQDVFVQCYQNYEKSVAVASIKAWLYRIAINKSKDLLKSAGFKRVIRDSNLFAFFTSWDLSPEKDLLKRSEEEFLSRSVLLLPIKYREVITLYYYEECSIEEISSFLGTNQNTIKTRLNRGREKLKKMMERGGYDGEKT